MIFVFYLSQYNPGGACRALIKGRKEKCQVIRSQSATISKSKRWLFPTEELCSFVLLEVVFTPWTSRELWAQETLTESINVEVACYSSCFGESTSHKQSWEINDEYIRVCHCSISGADMHEFNESEIHIKCKRNHNAGCSLAQGQSMHQHVMPAYLYLGIIYSYSRTCNMFSVA